MSLRKIASQLGITPAYLSYMVNGKRPWRQDLYQRYCFLVNTSVNTEAVNVNKKLPETGNGGLPIPLTQPESESIMGFPRARSSVVERSAHNRLVAGSIPAGPTRLYNR